MKKDLKKIIAGIMVTVFAWNSFAMTGTGYIPAVQAAALGTSADTQSSSENTEADTSVSETTEQKAIDTNQSDSTTESDDSTLGNPMTTTETTETEETEENRNELMEGQENDVMTSTYDAANSVNIPHTVEELVPGTVYYVRTYDDVLALQELSYQSNLDGCIFEFAKLNNTNNVWDFTNIGFNGLGNETYPFQGTVQEYFQSGTTFKMARPMFNYLGTGAVVKNFTFDLANATSGIADYFILNDQQTVLYENVTLTGTVSNPSGNAGALYGTVQNNMEEQYEFVIDDTGLNVKQLTVSGQLAGGYLGEAVGNIKLTIKSGANVAKSVNATAIGAGGIVGKLSAQSSLVIDSNVTIDNTVTGTGSVGGVVGICENASIQSTGKVIKNTDLYGSVNAGGFVGLITNSQVEISNFILNGMVRASNYSSCYAGGVVGQYNATNDTAVLKISKIGVNSNRIGAGYADTRGNSCGAGGVIGYIHGDNVTISNIAYDDSEYAFLPDLRYHGQSTNTANATSATGGIAGRVAGKNIEISNIRVSFISTRGIAGNYAGDIFGYVETLSKVRVTDITVAANYVSNSPGYNGGIAGYVDKGCVIALCGNLDLSGISYLNNRTGVYGTNKGYIAGGQKESILYLEKDAVLTKNETAGDYDNSVWLTDYYNYYTYYTIDDVGTYGGVYKNIEDADGNLVIQYDNAYGQEITGTVEYADGKYQLQHIADAMRLAIALGTLNADDTEYALRFGANCFQAGETGKSLLAADYEVTADLDFSLAGIYSLCRNDSIQYEFSGTMEGKQKADGEYPVISLGIASKQNYGGLFPKIKDAAFKNLQLSGYLYYTQNFGGIAYYGEGNVTLDGIYTDMKMRTSSHSQYYTNNVIYYYGGLIGQYKLENGTFICRNCVVAPVIENIRVQQIAGGMVGYINTGKNTVSEANVIVDNVQIKSQLTADTKFSHNHNYTYTQARVAGMFAYIGYDVTGNQSGVSTLGGNIVNATYSVLKLTNISVEDACIDLSRVTSNKQYVRATGGFLGYEWNNVEVSIDGLTVDDSQINSLGRVGGLVTTLAGKLDLDHIALNSMTMNDKNGSQSFSGLLVGDGRYALVTLYRENYTIDSSVTISGYSNFDEIVGVNCKLKDNGVNTNGCGLAQINGITDYSEGGIVNIIMPEFQDMTSDAYESYHNQVITQSNQYTRYYYNLFGDAYDANKITVNGTSAEINSQEKLMLWHLYKYMNGNIQRFITPYFEGGSPSNVNTWNLSGNLDMNGYSYYPTRVSNETYHGDNAVITLYGEVLEDKEADNKKPSDSLREHYMMHAALFYASANVTAEGITFKGTGVNLGSKSGVLFAGTLSGITNIKNITCDGVRLSNYTNETGAGLLVGIVVDGSDVMVDTVYTTGYGDDDIAAAALIGIVGSSDARNIHISFQNMQVEDEKDKLFRYASFIYSYDSVDNSDINKCFGLYTFTKDDFDSGNVTYGKELSYGVDYYDLDRDAALQAIIDASDASYHPYVYIVKNILVNPRNGNITEGCGTYEDPYVISNRKQFLTLYCYLTGSSGYDDIFNIVDSTGCKWSVNPIGGGLGDGRCNLTDDLQSHTAIEFGDAEFPSRDELRTAYYIIADDIDLSVYSDLNEYVVASDFSGLGTTTYPFSGVMIGQKSDGTIPTIILPNTRTDSGRYQDNYGFIQYIKGAVVKNLNITCPDGAVQVESAGGGVAAISLGGDNIIENVTVDIDFTVYSTGTATGGYVGYVKKGSVIIRNITIDNIENYTAGYLKSGIREEITTENHSSYRKNCRVIGWVYDGFVLYEGTNIGSDTMVVDESDFYTDLDDTASIPLSYSFPMVNGNYLQANSGDSASDGKITVSGDAGTGFNIIMHNAAQMEIAALALNADAFSIYNSGQVDANHYNGYDYTAICRKAAYSDVDCGISGRDTSSDYALATGNDDTIGYYPYLYWKYMDFSGVSGGYEATQKVEDEKRLSYLNWSDGSGTYGGININNIVTTYMLDEGKTYDLSGFGRSFRGFGALYNNAQDQYSLLKANFNGRNATVIADMERDWDSSITVTGLFNNLTSYREDGFTIENVTILNSSFQNMLAVTSGTGAVAGYVKGVWNFKNITLERNTPHTTKMDVEGNSYTGGLVGCIRYYSSSASDAAKQQILFENCKITGTADYTCQINGGTSVGGIVGYVEGVTVNTITYYGDIVFKDCHVSNGLITTDNGHIGGFAGRIGNAYAYGNTGYASSRGTVTIVQSEGNVTPTIQNTTVQSNYTNGINSVGGLIGEYVTYYNNANSTTGEAAKNLSIQGVIIDGLKAVSAGSDTRYYGVGGLCGGTWSYVTKLADVTVKNAQIGYSNSGTLTNQQRLSSGGLFGSIYNTQTEVTDVQVLDSQIGSYSNRAGGYFGDGNPSNLVVQSDDGTNLVENTIIQSVTNGAGGLIGANTYGLTAWTLSDVKIQNSQIKSSVAANDNYAAGGLIGKLNSAVATINLSEITVGNETDVAGCHAGGLIGYLCAGQTKLQLDTYIFIGCKEDTAAGTGAVQDSGYSNIYGYANAGGLFGYNNSYGQEIGSGDIQIQKMRIGAYISSGSLAQATAGGLTGLKMLHSNSCIYDKILIQDCIIAANYYANYKVRCGGLYGKVENGVSNNNFAGIYIYNPQLINNSIGYGPSLTSLETLKSLTKENVNLLIDAGASAHWSTLDINENTVAKYAARIGNYVGEWNSQEKHLYILRPTLIYDDNFTGSRPVIDIGNGDAGTADYSKAYGYGYPYEWRQYCHIVYFEPDAAVDASSIVDTGLLVNSEHEYLYSSIDAIVSDYDSAATGEDYLKDYHLNVAIDSENSILDYYEKCVESRSLNGVDVVYADGGTAQDILDSAVGILTNVGGIYSSSSDASFKKLLSVSAVKAKITSSGKIVSDTGRIAQSILVENNNIKYQELTYDTINADGSYTITLLYFRYGWQGADGSYKYETIYVPVFVVERIAFYSDLSIMEGEQYSLEKANDPNFSYSGAVTVAHDSTYTLFAEFAYGAGRKKTAYENFSVDKTMVFQKAIGQTETGEYIWGEATIPVGMKFTLVDVESGKPYYYTVEEDGITCIDFTAFFDGAQNPYTNREIGDIGISTTDYHYGTTDLSGYDFGLEQFYIYVDPSDVAEMENAIFKISISTEKTQEAVTNFLDRTEYEGIQVTWMPGLSISFEGKGQEGITFIGGNISQEETVQIDTRIQITADQTYWDEKGQEDSNFIDSENNNKYLDIAIYLIDKTSGEYVNLPEGTNIIMNGGDPYATSSQYVTYCYRDWGAVFPIGTVTENLTGDQTIVDETTGMTVNNACSIVLDFSLADLDDYIDNRYDIYLELRRTSDPDYPLGGKKVDEYSEQVTGIGNKDMAVALSVEDMMDLGINTYQETTSSYEIPFTTKLDFTDMINGDKPVDITACAEKKYLVTYRIKKKVGNPDGTYEYVLVGDALAADSPSELQVGEELKLISSETDGEEALTLTTYNGETVYQMVRTFSESDIKKGTDGIPYLVSWDLSLLVNTEDMNDADLSNYMVEVTILPYSPYIETETGDLIEADIPDSDENGTLIDYFIFTIGKIKTDM